METNEKKLNQRPRQPGSGQSRPVLRLVVPEQPPDKPEAKKIHVSKLAEYLNAFADNLDKEIENILRM